MRNIYKDAEAQPIVAKLKVELKRLQEVYGDTNNLYLDPATWPKSTADVAPPSKRKSERAR
jgi:hypothetical protein